MMHWDGGFYSRLRWQHLGAEGSCSGLVMFLGSAGAAPPRGPSSGPSALPDPPLLQVLSSDVALVGDCHFCHCSLLVRFVHHHIVQLVLHRLLVCIWRSLRMVAVLHHLSTWILQMDLVLAPDWMLVCVV